MKHLVINQEGIKGRNWIIRLARKRRIGKGFHLYDEETDLFEKIDPFEVQGSIDKMIRLYVFDNERCVFRSFQQASHYGFGQECKVDTVEEPCTIIHICPFEGDFFLPPDYLSGFCTILNMALESRSMRDLTPEQRYFIFLQEAKEREEALKAEAEKLKTIEGQLRYALEIGGATYISHYERRGKYIINWAWNNKRVNSVVNSDLSIDELGFCASGYDKTQNLTSAVLLLKAYDEENFVHITRHA